MTTETMAAACTQTRRGQSDELVTQVACAHSLRIAPGLRGADSHPSRAHTHVDANTPASRGRAASSARDHRRLAAYSANLGDGNSVQINFKFFGPFRNFGPQKFFVPPGRWRTTEWSTVRRLRSRALDAAPHPPTEPLRMPSPSALVWVCDCALIFPPYR